jgi:exopolysaccharide production protein ExoQ
MKGKNLEIAEKCFVVLSLTFFSTGGLNIGGTADLPGIIPDSILTTLRYSIWVTSAFLTCLSWKKALPIAGRDIFIWILTIITSSSIVWSVYPEHTLKYMRELWLMTSFGLYFSTRFSIKEQLKLVAWTLGIGAILSAYFGLRVTGIGRHWGTHQGAWKGIYDYKNTLGSLMVLGSLAFFLLPIDNPKNRKYKWGGFVLMLILMLLSTSKTSLVLSFLLIFILSFYRNFQWQGKITVIYLDIAILISGCVGTIVFSQWADILGGLGKDPTLTGRTLMWGVALNRLDERFWLGFGRGAYWAPDSKYAIETGQSVTQSFVPPHIHNGFIEIALDVGFIGLSFFLISFAITYFRALKLAYATKNSEDVWPLAIWLFLFLNNITESYLMRNTNLFWVLYITIALSVMPRYKLHKK